MNNEDIETIRKLMKTVGIKVTFYGYAYKYVKVKVEKNTVLKPKPKLEATDQENHSDNNGIFYDEDEQLKIKKEEILYDDYPESLNDLYGKFNDMNIFQFAQKIVKEKLQFFKKYYLLKLKAGKRMQKRINGRRVQINPFIFISSINKIDPLSKLIKK